MLFLQPTVRGLAIIRRIVMGSVPQMMIVNMIGYVVVMDVEDTLVLTLLKCVK